MDTDFKTLSKESYEKNDVAYASVEMFSRNFAQINFKLFRKIGNDKAEITDHPLLELLENPNPKQGKGEFLQALSAYTFSHFQISDF